MPPPPRAAYRPVSASLAPEVRQAETETTSPAGGAFPRAPRARAAASGGGWQGAPTSRGRWLEGRRPQEGASRFRAPGRAAGDGAREPGASRFLCGRRVAGEPSPHCRANSDTCSLTRRMSRGRTGRHSSSPGAKQARRAGGPQGMGVRRLGSRGLLKEPGRLGTHLPPPAPSSVPPEPRMPSMVPLLCPGPACQQAALCHHTHFADKETGPQRGDGLVKVTQRDDT